MDSDMKQVLKLKGVSRGKTRATYAGVAKNKQDTNDRSPY